MKNYKKFIRLLWKETKFGEITIIWCHIMSLKQYALNKYLQSASVNGIQAKQLLWVKYKAETMILLTHSAGTLIILKK